MIVIPKVDCTELTLKRCESRANIFRVENKFIITITISL